MSITNLQQARQMYAMGQRVAKTLDGSRPGYRGPGGYQGGASSRGGPPGGGATAGGSGRDFSPGPSKSSTSKSTSSTSQHSPHTRSGYTGPTNYGPQQPPQQFIGGKSYDVTPTTRDERDRATLKQQILNQTVIDGNRIDKFGNTKKSPFKQGSGLGSLIMGALGMLMGIPGLGLLTGGIRSLGGGLKDLNRKFRGVNPDGTTRTQAQYEKARYDRQQVNRLDKLFAAKDRGYNQIGFGDFTKKTMDFTPGQQAKIDQLMAAGYMPSTARNVDSARGSNLRNNLAANNITKSMPSVNITGLNNNDYEGEIGAVNNNDFVGLNTNATDMQNYMTDQASFTQPGITPTNLNDFEGIRSIPQLNNNDYQLGTPQLNNNDFIGLNQPGITSTILKTAIDLKGTKVGYDSETQINTFLTDNVITFYKSLEDTIKLDLDKSNAYTVVMIQNGKSTQIIVNGGGDSTIKITQGD